MIHRIEIDPYACCGHGDCVDIAPSVFALDGDVATVIGDGPAALLVRAAEACPSAAIAVTEDGTGTRLFP
jgi:ferredoxin